MKCEYTVVEEASAMLRSNIIRRDEVHHLREAVRDSEHVTEFLVANRALAR